jgi:hypothetical protein
MTKQIELGHALAHFGFAHKQMGNGGFELLPRHAARQNGKWLTQVEHHIKTQAKEVFGGRAHGHRANPQK